MKRLNLPRPAILAAALFLVLGASYALLEDGCYSYIQKSSHVSEPDDVIEVSTGQSLSPTQSAAVSQAIEMLAKWEEYCGVEFDDPAAPGTPKKPSDTLGGLHQAKSICQETADWGDQPGLPDEMPKAQTAGRPESINVGPLDGGNGWTVEPCLSGAPGINVNSDEFPEPEPGSPDADGNPVFYDASIADLAATLMHEAYHALFSTGTEQSFIEREEQAYRNAAEQMCKVVACDEPEAGVTDQIRNKLCEVIREANSHLCKAELEPVCCDACENFGGSLPDERGSCTCDDDAPPPPPPADNDDDDGDFLPPFDEMTFVSGDKVFLNRETNTLTFSFEQPSGPNVVEQIPVSDLDESLHVTTMTLVSRSKLLLAGFDSITGDGRLAELEFRPEIGVTSFVSTYAGSAFASAIDLSRKGPTPIFYFLDHLQGLLMRYDISSGTVTQLYSYATTPNYQTYVYLILMPYFDANTHERLGTSFVLFSDDPSHGNWRVLIPPYAIRLQDEDDDGDIDFTIP